MELWKTSMFSCQRKPCICATDFGALPYPPPPFRKPPKKGPITGKLLQDRAEFRMELQKRARGNEFPRALSGQVMRDNVSVLRGTETADQPFTMEAISSAKFSCFFSMPSPFSKRMASLKVTLPPSALAAEAIYFSTVMELSFTNSCCSRQFSE